MNVSCFEYFFLRFFLPNALSSKNRIEMVSQTHFLKHGITVDSKYHIRNTRKLQQILTKLIHNRVFSLKNSNCQTDCELVITMCNSIFNSVFCRHKTFAQLSYCHSHSWTCQQCLKTMHCCYIHTLTTHTLVSLAM